MGDPERCPACGHESERVYRCDNCGHDLVEGGDSGHRLIADGGKPHPHWLFRARLAHERQTDETGDWTVEQRGLDGSRPRGQATLDGGISRDGGDD